MFPLSSSVVNLLVECLSGSQIWITKATVALAVKIIFGECMEHLLQVSTLSLVSAIISCKDRSLHNRIS